MEAVTMGLQWPLIVFTTFICLAAGTFGSVAIASLREEYERIQLPGLVTAFAALVIGGGASVLHLETPARYFGQLGNIRSGINQEIIMMALVGAMMVIYFIQLRRDGNAGKAVKIVSAALSLVLVLVMGHLYMMPARPAWDTVLLPVYYAFNAVLLGALVAALLLAAGKPDAARQANPATAALAALGAFALCTAAYAFHITSLSRAVYSDVLHVDTTTVPPLDPAAIGERLISGDLALLFWGAVIVVGLVLPLAALLAARKATAAALIRNSAAAGIVLVLAGGLAFRVLLYFAASTVFVY
jgi:anaerobic dimethyl sulfoxide reductase subunit C (anchor subunit)